MRNALAVVIAVGTTFVAIREARASCNYSPQLAPATVVPLGCPVRVFSHYAQPIADPRLVVESRGVDVTDDVAKTMVELAITDHSYVANTCEEALETFTDVFERHDITLAGAEVGDVVRLVGADPGHAMVTFTVGEAGACQPDPQPAGYHCYEVRKAECEDAPPGEADPVDEIASCSTTGGSSSLAALGALGAVLAGRRRRCLASKHAERR